MKHEYFKEITELLSNCNDMSLVDFIFQLLKKHSEQV